jgi:hypothetical protein
MAVEFAVLKKKDVESLESFTRVNAMAEELRQYLDQEKTQQQILERHILGASSALIQDVVKEKLIALGFVPEKRGLFDKCTVPALRPDYFCNMGAHSGILLEVERGKTTTNNMDLLDFWKCHICEHAEYLFLLVPQKRTSANGTVLKHFQQVKKRLGVFLSRRITSMSTQSICSATEREATLNRKA